MEIIVQPILAQLDYRTLDNLRKDISREFENIKATAATGNNSNLVELKKDASFQSSFDKDRNQWYSPKLLVCFFQKFRPNKDTKMLFILDVDAYSDGLNYVLGEAYPKGGLGIIYLPRIRQEFYGLKPDNEIFYKRMVKESVHELGHVFGFVHCQNPRCVMRFSNTLSDTDNKERSFCHSCREKYFRLQMF
ncbi:MAG: archaemetzincin family Zn-dependent metalloprotease [Nitrososphaeraceae archaeon]